MKTYKLTSGLGDCLIAGAALQALDTKVKFITNPLLKPVFEYHPTIEFATDGSPDLTFQWVSQLSTNLYALHTMQRFSVQAGLYVDPTNVLKIYDQNHNQLIGSGDLIVVNEESAEVNRRYIPNRYIERIEAINGGKYEIKYIGNGPRSTCRDIGEMIQVLLRAKVFIGPVSFCYHLASCLHVKCILFTGYMPPHKFSHFFNTTAITANAPCSFMCEEQRRQCSESCQALNYDCVNDEIDRILCQHLR